MLDKRKSLHTPAKLEIVAVVSDSADRMFDQGSATTILLEEALLCRLCLRSVEKLIRLKAGGVRFFNRPLR